MKDKEKAYSFHGPYSSYFYKYIDFKRGTGRKYGRTSVFFLQELERFFDRHPGLSPDEMLSKEAVNSFTAKRPNESLKSQYMRMNFIHDFAVFVNECGGQAYVYPAGQYVSVKSDFCPYIFTHDEIQQLFEVVDHLPYRKKSPKYHLIYPMLLRLLYGCGLRINEALLLNIKDVDTTQGTVSLLNTKNGSQRLVPMSASLWEYTKDYLKRMGYPDGYNGYFFASPDGGHYNSTPVYVMLKKYMKTAGISRDDGTVPRVHDLRHTFAVHVLEKMDREGFDLYHTLPILSTYLGHSSIRSTEKYLRLTFQTRDSITESMSGIYQDVFPEV